MAPMVLTACAMLLATAPVEALLLERPREPSCSSWCFTSTKSWAVLCHKRACELCNDCEVEHRMPEAEVEHMMPEAENSTAVADDTTTEAENTTEVEITTGAKAENTPTNASRCQGWCSTSTKSWDQLCKRHNCASCGECSHLGCMSWCAGSTRTWGQLCQRKGCGECSECGTANKTTTTTTTPALSLCEGWCLTSSSSWDRLCTSGSCAGCGECAHLAGCQPWCANMTQPWEFLCTIRDCADCSDCEAPIEEANMTYNITIATTTLVDETLPPVMHTEEPMPSIFQTPEPATMEKLPPLAHTEEPMPSIFQTPEPATMETVPALVHPEPISSPAAAAQDVTLCMEPGGVTALPYRGNIGHEYTVDCAGCCLSGDVWGVGPFTDLSSICGAAYFLGVVDDQGVGLVVVEVQPGVWSYDAGNTSRRQTAAFGPWPGSFLIKGPAAGKV